jgi:Reverse transcriptase (RNA-dependent DNA polymerase)
LKVDQAVNCHHFTFPEFSKSLKYNELTCQVFNQAADCNYDFILGHNFLIPAKLDLYYTDLTMRWHGRIAPMKVTNTPQSLCIDFADDPSDEIFITDIKGRKYEQANLSELVASQDHLTLSQCESLLALLQQHQSLFSGKLGKYTTRQLHLELKDGAQPIHCKPYPVPKVHEQLFKDEAGYLVSDGVLEPVGATEHAYPTFNIPKKDGCIRWVSDFRKLNAMLRRSIYPLPRIHDILTKRKGYQYFTKLDLSMQYYTLELDELSSWLCVIVTPFGKFRYKCLPMGIKCSPGFAQEIMESILFDLSQCDVYIDDVGVFSNSFGDHLQHLAQVLQ